jgi:hypothetical protein
MRPEGGYAADQGWFQEASGMAYGAIFDVPAPIESYDEALPIVESATHGMPPGCQVHIVTPTATGYRVIEVWDSEMHWREFRTRTLTPILQRLTQKRE